MLCLLLPKAAPTVQPLLGLVVRGEPLERSYVREHVRTLPSGKRITIPAYFTKVTPKGKQDTARKPRAVKQEPPKGVYQPQTPEQLAHRLVRHVQEGTMTHEEALANILHLEERAGRGEGLTHAGGHQWTAEHLKEFGHHARTKLHAHLTERKRKQDQQSLIRETIAELYGPQQSGQQPQPRPQQGITYQERQTQWEAKMRQRQQQALPKPDKKSA